jgi:hypothetical protein
MIRRVAFKKACIGGAAGALAWELAARAFLLLGLPVFDLVHILGDLALGSRTGFPAWWVAGLILHLTVGAIWAVFYAYFFWSTFALPPYLQGLAFSLFPALLAGLIMVPQMDLMLDGTMQSFGPFAFRMGWGGPLLLIVGHLIYGTVMGSIYTRPVGYPVGRRIAEYG